MTTTTHISISERFGRWLGRGWRGYVRSERRVSEALVAKGVPVAVATAVMWAVKLAVLGVLLYVAFWIALLLVFAVAGAWAARNTDWDDTPEPEWKNGMAGFGLYTYDGFRIDPHVSDDD